MGDFHHMTMYDAKWWFYDENWWSANSDWNNDSHGDLNGVWNDDFLCNLINFADATGDFGRLPGAPNLKARNLLFGEVVGFGEHIKIQPAKLRNPTWNGVVAVIRFPNEHILIHGMTKQNRASTHETVNKKR